MLKINKCSYLSQNGPKVIECQKAHLAGPSLWALKEKMCEAGILTDHKNTVEGGGDVIFEAGTTAGRGQE